MCDNKSVKSIEESKIKKEDADNQGTFMEKNLGKGLDFVYKKADMVKSQIQIEKEFNLKDVAFVPRAAVVRTAAASKKQPPAKRAKTGSTRPKRKYSQSSEDSETSASRTSQDTTQGDGYTTAKTSDDLTDDYTHCTTDGDDDYEDDDDATSD